MHQAMEAQVALVEGLATQWMGVLLRPKAPSDAWVAAGLAAYLVDSYVRKVFGHNELLFRCVSAITEGCMLAGELKLRGLPGSRIRRRLICSINEGLSICCDYHQSSVWELL